MIQSGNSDAANMLIALRSFLGANDMMAYLAMMAVRLIELHRVLKPTGSLYLHCDPTASHYLKIVLDAVFGVSNYRNEIMWRRTNARGTTGRWPKVHDTLLFYSKSNDFQFHSLKVNADKSKLPHTLVSGGDGRKYQSYELTAPGQTKDGESGKPWRGFDPYKMGRHWGNNAATMNAWDDAGLVHWPKDGGFPRRRDAEPFDPEGRQVVVGSVWTDIDRLNQTAKERLGYPTQKPLALLERIISASSSEGDLVLDPFCGCGTTVHAAQKLKRRWIGIDITHIAVGLIQRRLHDAFPMANFDVLGVPKDADSAAALALADKHQFQLWALSVVEAQPYKGGRKGADGGVDGYIFFKPDGKTTQKAIVSVKGGGHVGDTMVKDLITTVEHEGATMGVFITLARPTGPMITRAASAGLYKTEWGVYPKIQILTVEDLFLGRRPDMPWLDPGAFKRAKREAAPDTQGVFEI